MTRNRSNQYKHLILKPTNIITTSKPHQLFLEDNESIDMINKHIVKNLPIPTNIKDSVKEEYCNNNLITSDKNFFIKCKYK